MRKMVGMSGWSDVCRVALRMVAGSVACVTLAAQGRPDLPRPDPATAFRVSVLISAARALPPEDIRRLVTRADQILFEKTGARMIAGDVVNLGVGDAVKLAQRYVDAHASDPPDGVILFGDDEEVTTYGGYTAILSLPSGQHNRFPTPAIPVDVVYVAVIDGFHKYAACGYDGRGNRVSATSRGGECRSHRGLTCVDNGQYWMCPDSTTDLNADRDYFLGCDIVHEFIHPFGTIGDDDHYGTPQCTARTGMSPAEAGDRKRFQESCGMCPDLFAQFKPRK